MSTSLLHDLNTYELSSFMLYQVDNDNICNKITLIEKDLEDNFLETLPGELGQSIKFGPTVDKDRSSVDWHIATKLYELGFDASTVLSVFTNPEWKAGSKAEDVGFSYITNTVQNAWSRYNSNKKNRPITILQKLIRQRLIKGAKLVIPVQSYPVVIECAKKLEDSGYSFMYDVDADIPLIVTDVGELIKVNPMNRYYTAWISRVTQFTSESRAFRMFMNGFQAYCTHQGTKTKLRRWCYFNADSMELYLLLDHTANSSMLYVNSEGKRNVVKNGYNGVVLHCSPRTTGIDIDYMQVYADARENYQRELRELIDLTYGNFAVSESMKVFITCFMFALPIASGYVAHGTMPFLHLTGGYGEGKTDILKALATFIHGTPEVEAGTTLASARMISDRDIFLPFDDYEKLSHEMHDFILTTASGAVRHKVNTKADGTVKQRSHICLALTSISDLDTPTLRRRSVQVKVSSKEFPTLNYTSNYKDDIINRRDTYWASYVEFLKEFFIGKLTRREFEKHKQLVDRKIVVSEFKSLADFIALCDLIRSYLGTFDSRFDDDGLLDIWCKDLKLVDKEVLLKHDPIRNAMRNIFENHTNKLNMSEQKDSKAINKLSITGAKLRWGYSVVKSLFSELPEYMERPEELEGKPLVVLSGTANMWAAAIRVYTVHNRDIPQINARQMELYIHRLLPVGVKEHELLYSPFLGAQGTFSRVMKTSIDGIWIQLCKPSNSDTAKTSTYYRLIYPTDLIEQAEINAPISMTDTNAIKKLLATGNLSKQDLLNILAIMDG